MRSVSSRLRDEPSRAAFLALGALLVLGARDVRADEASDSVARDPAGAEVLFQKGRLLMETGKLTEACPIFEESYRLDPAPGTLLNIAACSRLSGKTATAWGQFLEAERAFVRKGDPRRAAFAKQQAGEIEPMLAHVIVRADKPVAGLVIRRDGTTLTAAALETKLPIDPGKHVVVAEAEGYERVELTFEAEARTTAEWTIPELVPVQVKASDLLPPDTNGRRDTQRIAGFVVGGVGLSSLVAGGVFIGLTAMQSSDLEALCPTKRCTTAEGVDALAKAEQFANAANGLLIAGGVLAATGLIVVLTAPSDDSDDLAVSLAPAPTGLALFGRF